MCFTFIYNHDVLYFFVKNLRYIFPVSISVLFEVTHSLNSTVSVIRVFFLFEIYDDTLNAEIVFMYLYII